MQASMLLSPVFLALFLALFGQIGVVSSSVLDSVDAGMDLSDLVTFFKEFKLEKSRFNELEDIAAHLKLFMDGAENLPLVRDLVDKLQLHKEIDVPCQIIRKSVVDFLNSPSNFTRSYLAETCVTHAPPALLLKFEGILSDNMSAIWEAVVAHNFSSPYVKQMVQKLWNGVDQMGFVHGFCHALLNQTAVQTKSVFLKHYVNFKNVVDVTLRSIQTRYFDEAALLVVQSATLDQVACQKQSNCNWKLAETVQKNLQQQFDYGDVFYVKVTSSECRYKTGSKSLVAVMHLNRNVFVSKSKPHKIELDSRVQSLKSDFFALNKKMTIFGNRHCMSMLSKRVELPETAGDIVPYCENYDMCFICETDPEQGVMDEPHVHSQTHDICDYMVLGDIGVSVTYGNSLKHGPADPYIEKFYSDKNDADLKKMVEKVNLMINQLQEASNSTIVTRKRRHFHTKKSNAELLG